MITVDLICKEFLTLYKFTYNKTGKEIPEDQITWINRIAQKNVDITIRKIDLKMSLSEFSEKYIKPAAARLARDTPENATYLNLYSFNEILMDNHIDMLCNIIARASIGIPDKIQNAFLYEEVPDPIILRFDVIYVKS